MGTAQQFINQVNSCHAPQAFDYVAKQLAMIIAEETALVSELGEAILARFPPGDLEINPHLLYYRGILATHQGALEQAITLLQRALVLYQHQRDANGAANSCLALITLHLSREDFSTAHLQMLEAERLLARVADEAIQTRLYLRLAELCPDIGRVAESIGFAQHALQAAHNRSHLADQFKALLLLAILYRTVGDYEQAAAHLTLARQVQQTGGLADAGYSSVLNAEAHLAWYRGELTTALELAQQLHQRVQSSHPDKRLLYCLTLQGNLYRAQGDFPRALALYHDARQVATQLGQTLYTPWLDAHEGWLYSLAGDYAAAQRALYHALSSADRGQIMSFNVNLGLLYLLQERAAAAEPLLTASLAFYQQSGDALAGAVLRFYLAWLYTQQHDCANADSYLTAALTWFAERNITYFPLWYHPRLVTQVCALAIIRDRHAALAERMVSRHIGSTAIVWLEARGDTVAPQEAARLQPLLDRLRQCDDSWMRLLQQITDAPARQALYELLATDQLQRQNFPRLMQRLTTADRRPKANPVLVAVFGLYLQGASQHEIARKLQRAPATIRNYITHIYQLFELSPAQVKGRNARKTRLRALAEKEGFVTQRSA